MKIYFCFFVQAEDGIRDKLVTGVQTCALPISAIRSTATTRRAIRWGGEATSRRHPRSEERRVGKGVDLGGRRIIKKKKKKLNKKKQDKIEKKKKKQKQRVRKK